MRLTISHGKSKPEVIRAVDRSFEELFKGLPVGPLQVSDTQKSWEGSVLTFALTAKMGLIRNPIRGTVEVTDKDITIDADLGMLNHLIPENKAKAIIQERVQKLLP